MNALCNITFLLRIRRKSHHRTISSLQKRLLGHAINVIHILNSHRSWREKWDYFNSKKKKIEAVKLDVIGTQRFTETRQTLRSIYCSVCGAVFALNFDDLWLTQRCLIFSLLLRYYTTL